MRPLTIPRGVALGMLTLLVSGCGFSDSIKGERQSVAYYSLDNGAALPAAGDGATGRLGLERWTTRTPINHNQLVYRPAAESHVHYLYPEQHRWAAPPGEMAAELAMRYFASRFAEVGGYPGDRPPDLVLSADLVQFEEVRPRGQAAGTAVVVIEGQVRRRDRSVTPFRVRGEAPVARRDPDAVDGEALARALRVATLQALEALAERLR